MKRRAAFYRNSDGVEIDEDEAFESGILKDGIVATVSMMMRDSLSPLQRAVAADSDRRVRVSDPFGNPAGHRPGHVFAASDQAAQDAKARAYADYDREQENAWRTPFQSGQADSSTCLDGVPDHADRPPNESRRDVVSAEEALRDHSRLMQGVYRLYETEIAEKWRRG